MKPIDDDLMVSLMLTDPVIARLTEAVVSEALDSLPVLPKRDMNWIARAIQGALFTSRGAGDGGPDRQSNSETRDELARLSYRVSSLWRTLTERSSAADDALWKFAFQTWDGAGGTEIDGLIIGEPQQYRQFSEDVARLDSLAGFLKEASEAIDPQGPNWRRAELREQRVLRAQCLSPIYEQAYGLEPTVNSWPGTKSLGPWSEFYQRVVALAFGEKATPDLEGVLDEARRRDKQHRVEFAPGVIPD